MDQKQKEISSKSATIVAIGVFCLTTIVLILLGYYIAGGMLGIGLGMATRQFLLRRIFDAIVTLIVFAAIFVFYIFGSFWNYTVPLPILAVAVGIVWFLRELLNLLEEFRKKK